jgi:hypothetical protein
MQNQARPEEVRELFVGTWIGVSLVADALI